MSIGALLIVGGILLLNAAIRDENIANIISDVFGGKQLKEIDNGGFPVQGPQNGTGPINGVLGTGTGAKVLTNPNGSPMKVSGGGYVGRSNRPNMIP